MLKKLSRTFAISALVFGLLLVGLFSSVKAQSAPTEAPSKSDEAPIAVAVADSELILVEGKGAGKKHHIFPAGWCTRYAADTYRDRSGKIVTWRGNAKDWFRNAANEGYSTSNNKYRIAVNAIVVFGATRTNSYGHVAIIDSISTDGKTLVVSEMNWKGFGIKSTRTIKFADLGRLQFVGVILP